MRAPARRPPRSGNESPGWSSAPSALTCCASNSRPSSGFSEVGARHPVVPMVGRLARPHTRHRDAGQHGEQLQVGDFWQSSANADNRSATSINGSLSTARLPRLLSSRGDARGALITSAPYTIRQPATPLPGTRHPTTQRISHRRKKKLSHALGDNALRETGLGAPTISTHLKQRSSRAWNDSSLMSPLSLPQVTTTPPPATRTGNSLRNSLTASEP